MGGGFSQAATFVYKAIMKLLFIAPSGLQFTAQTPEHAPLGGTESCAAWLTRHLVARGHDVTLVADLPPGTPPMVAGVRHVAFADTSEEFFTAGDFDAIITISSPHWTETLKRAAPRALQVAWIHMMPDQPALATLWPQAPHIDCALFVSRFQETAMRYPGVSHVIGNGIAPPFENLFASPAELLAAKQNRAVYTSAPYRGLNILVPAFAQAQVATELDIYSGMATYQQADTAGLAVLYDSARNTPRCHLHGPVSQQELAARLKKAAFLTFPCLFEETYCIAALEAMAAGAKMISTQWAALPETTLGHADLMPIAGLPYQEIPGLFARRIEANVADYLARPEEWAQERFAQAQDITHRTSWRTRAAEWEMFLSRAIAWKQGA